MNQHNKSFLRRAHEDQSGQVMGMLWVMMFLLFAFAALVVDFGRIYFSFRELQSSTDAAALAGGYDLPYGATQGENAATLYSGVAGNKNAYPNLPGVTMSYTLKCLTTLTNQGIACAESPANANAIQVTQTVSVPLIFAGILGARPVTLSATSTAAMRGSSPIPYNVVIVVDSTQSMTNGDSGGNCPGSRESCALSGVQTLLQSLSPCGSTLSSCGAVTGNTTGGGGQVTNPVDQVSLLTFPAVTTASANADYACPTGTPTIEPYPLPTPPAYTTYSNLPGSIPATTYQIVNFSSDYRTCDAASCGLSATSDIAIAAGGNSHCVGLRAIGGQGTYYAGVIYSAESLLLAQQAKNTNTQNALILISDGEAQATCTTIVKNVCTAGPLVGASTNSGVYPSTVQQCHQAITAAQWAAKQNAAGATVTGTKVYAVGYGAESSGCTTDTNPSITPCQTMRQIASDPAYFYTDYTSTTNGCVSASQPTSTINQIFTEIAMDFTVARLIPNNTP